MQKRLLIPIIIFCLFFMPSLVNEARGVEETQQKNLDKIIDDIKKTKENIKEQDEKESSILSVLNRLDIRLSKIRKEIDIYEYNLKSNQRKLEKTREQLFKIERDINNSYMKLKKRLRGIYKSGSIGLLHLLINAKSLNNIMESITLMRYIARYDTRLIDNLKKDRTSILLEEDNIRDYHERVAEYKRVAMLKKKELSKEQTQRENLLKTIKTDKNKQLKLLKEMEKRSRELKELIEKGSWAGGRSNFQKYRSKLIWPVQGDIKANFGFHYDNGLKRKLLNNGITIQASIGTKIRCVAEGKIAYADWFCGYGRLVIINHGEGYTTIYGHTSEIFVKDGQIVKEGETIAAVGDTDSIRGPGLYFEIRFNGHPIDPLLWLRKK